MNEVPNTYPHLFWAYAAVWSLFGAYLLYLGYRINKIEKRF